MSIVDDLQEAGAEVTAISSDSEKTHQQFALQMHVSEALKVLQTLYEEEK